jgi:hypothetical protein
MQEKKRMPRLALYLGLMLILSGFFGGAPAIAYAAEPVGGEVIAWRNLVFETPPQWYRVPEKEGPDNSMAVFASKSDGVLGVVTVSLLEGSEKDTPEDALSLLQKLYAQYQNKAAYSTVELQEQSQVSVLGLKQAPYLTYQREDQRYFVFFPPVSGEKYNINIVLPAGTGQKIPGFVGYFLERIHTATAWQKSQEKALAQSLQDMQQVRLRLPQVQTSPFLEIEALTQKQWDGAVAAAQQAVGMLYGDLSPEEQKQFNAVWAPMRGFPTQECVDYLNALNPLLGEFLALRTAINRTSGQLEQAMIEAGWAAELDAETLTREYLALAARYRDFLYSLQNRMDAVAKDIAALGDPPDAKALMARAQRQYYNAKKYVRSAIQQPEKTLEGIWVGYTSAVPTFSSIIKKEPIAFVIYNAAPPKKMHPDYRVVSLKVRMSGSDANPILAQYIGIGSFSNLMLLKEEHINTVSSDTYAVKNDDKSFFSYYAKRIKNNNAINISDVSLEKFENIAAQKIRKLAEEIAEYPNNLRNVVKKSHISSLKKRLKKVRAYYRQQPLFIATARQWLSEKPWITSEEQDDVELFKKLLKQQEHIATPKSPQQTVQRPARSTPPNAPSGSVLHATDDKTADERRQLDREAVAFHERNIQSIQRNLERDREELAEETDLKRRHALRQRILHGESDIQSERDRIATLKTGTLVHSRSPFDDYAKSRFIQNIARDQRKMETITKATENAYKLAERLPEDKARQIREAADKHLGPELMASLDAQQAREAVNTLYTVAKSHWEAERYKADADAAWADAGLQTAKSVKRRADQAMEYASMAGGQSVYMAYQGATGYIEGGPKEAVLRVAGSYNKVTGTVASAYRGYEQDGIKEAFLRVAGSYNEATGWAEDFYRGYQASDGDMLQAMGGATWKMTKAMAINKGTQFAANRISQRYATAPKSASTTLRKTAAGKKPKTGKQPVQALGRAKRKSSDPNVDFNRPLTDMEIKEFRAQVADGRTRVTSYKKTYAKLQKARKAKAPPKEIKKLLRELDDRAAKIHASPEAKIMMKNLQASPKNNDMVKRYCNAMDRVHTRVEKRFRDNMAQNGWKTQNMVPIRNKESGKSVNMDYDIALKEEKWFDENGKYNPWLTKNGEAVPVVAWQAEAQQQWNAAFSAETGQDAVRSFETVTFSKHPEAYADLKVLEKNGVLAADKGWAQQTGDVSQAKAWDMRENRNMGRVEKYVEIARGTAKDATRKLLPLLDNNKPKQGTPSYKVWEKHKNYWTKVTRVMEDMGSMKISPMEADRKIRLITGGKSVVEVTEDMSQLMSASITLGK